MNKKYFNERNKVILITVLAVVIIFFGTIILNRGMISINRKKDLKIIENYIKEEKYIEALEQLKSIKSIDKYNIEDINNYINILTEYMAIEESNDIKVILSNIENYINKYEETLNKDIFEKLKNELKDKIISYEEQVNILDEISKIKALIDKNVEEAEKLLVFFKEQNPLENVSDIEKSIQAKKIEISLEKESEELEKLDKIENEENKSLEDKDNIIEENQAITEKLGISETNAAQNSSQLITIVSNGGSYGELAMWEKDSSGNWINIDTISARLGQNGMKYYGDVYEMDKCTPTGIYTLSEAFGINGNPGSGVAYRTLDGSEYWVDDINSEYYNTMQFGEANGRWDSAEHLSSFPGYYNYALVIDYNRWPVVSGKSSAIFLHCDMGVYTYGCVAITENKLVNILNWINPSSNPKIILDFSYEDIYSNY